MERGKIFFGQKIQNHLWAASNLQTKHDLSKQQNAKAAKAVVGLTEFTKRAMISLQQTNSWDMGH